MRYETHDKYCENEINQPNFIVVFFTYYGQKSLVYILHWVIKILSFTD